MPSITQRKPMSGKQKKEQLKEKRAAQRDIELNGEPEIDTKPRQDPENYFLKFINDSDKTVQDNKILGYQPFQFDNPVYKIDQSIYLNEKLCPNLPQRPFGAKDMKVDQYRQAEANVFDKYFRSISPDLKTIDTDYCLFELNKEVYHQLWLVTEKSDVLCIITDARFPLAHIPINLLNYAKHSKKPVILLINKSDLVSNYQIQTQKAFLSYYLTSLGLQNFVIPFSATILFTQTEERKTFLNNLIQIGRNVSNIQAPELLTLGFIGQPSVGKSKTMNALYGKTICKVKLTAGCTKHLQTYFVQDLQEPETERSIMLCDCPGLVLPVKTAPRPLQIVTGVFPTGRTREFLSATRLVCESLSGFYDQLKSVVKLSNIIQKYNVNVNFDSPGGLLDSIAYQLNFLVKGGNPWTHRAGLAIFKKITDGSIPYEVRIDKNLCDKIGFKPHWEEYEKFSKEIEKQIVFDVEEQSEKNSNQ